MKVTIEVPDNTMVLTYQFVYEDEKLFHLKIQQELLDSKSLREFKEANRNAQDS